MAQGDLYKLLEETKDLLMMDTEWYRTFLNVQTHRYSNSVTNVRRELQKEIGLESYIANKPLLDKLIVEYVTTLYKRLTETSYRAYTIEVLRGSQRDFTIEITPKVTGTVGKPRISGSGTLIYDSVGSDPFKRVINEEKRKAMAPLLKGINELLGTDYSTSTFLDTGHLPQGVAIKQISNAVGSLDKSIDSRDDLTELAKASGVLARLKFTSKWIQPGTKKISIEVSDESAKFNRSKATAEKGFKAKTIKTLEKLLQKNKDWANQKGSDSLNEVIKKTLVNAAIKKGAKGKLQKINTASSSAKDVIKYQAAKSSTKDGGFSSTKSRKKAVFDLSLIALLNASLPEAIRNNMTGSALHNRTGRFSESASVTQVTMTPQGFPSIGYTYQRSPYDVFDRTLGKSPWNTPGRDPRTLVEKSIRDIARDMAIGRFYLRRI